MNTKAIHLKRNIMREKKIDIIKNIDANKFKDLIKKVKIWSLLRFVLVFGLCFLIIKPVAIKAVRSLITREDFYDLTVVYVPKNITFENIKEVWRSMTYPTAFYSTFKLSLIVSLLQIFSCSVVAYGFARYKFKYRDIWFSLVILTLVIPPQMTAISQFLNYRFFDFFGIGSILGINKVNILNTNWPFVFSSLFAVGFKNGIYIFMLRQVFKMVPKEIEEAALVDGAGPIRIFFKIMLPGAKSIIIAVGLFSFVWQWTDYFYVTWYFDNEPFLSRVLMNFTSSYLNNLKAVSSESSIDPSWVKQLADTGSLLIIIPVLIIYLIFQEYFVESIERSGIVG